MQRRTLQAIAAAVLIATSTFTPSIQAQGQSQTGQRPQKLMTREEAMAKLNAQVLQLQESRRGKGPTGQRQMDALNAARNQLASSGTNPLTPEDLANFEKNTGVKINLPLTDLITAAIKKAKAPGGNPGLLPALQTVQSRIADQGLDYMPDERMGGPPGGPMQMLSQMLTQNGILDPDVISSILTPVDADAAPAQDPAPSVDQGQNQQKPMTVKELAAEYLSQMRRMGTPAGPEGFTPQEITNLTNINSAYANLHKNNRDQDAPVSDADLAAFEQASGVKLKQKEQAKTDPTPPAGTGATQMQQNPVTGGQGEGQGQKQQKDKQALKDELNFDFPEPTPEEK